MRDVTDNVTGELAGLEQKRGRGRPSTGHAKSNAERQAAYRARRQAERDAGQGVAAVTKMKMPAEIDVYDECRLEVEALRAEIYRLNRLVESERALANHALKSMKFPVTPSNGNFVPAQEYQRLQLDVASLRRDNEYLEGEVTRLSGVNSALRAADKKSVTRKAVTKTSSNENPVSFDVMLDLISLAAKANTFEQRQKVRETVLWADAFVRTQLVNEAQMRAAGEAIYGERKVVTCKA
ncbi:hypothetical protein [Ralstonia solanacearum]|uniref:hypothetical protein n=1 Tax=Ralstonia solanacearum TaxID=305 RepID=UPI00202A34C8|nr:hypothetical protein [Ralstonia solanacearum]MCL9844604.1 hypothetical protein [Ralstonia solanacearum]MDC6253177.1 hypothetical protein [Ralstonia solanacearum]MDC6257759.1 hypothetical protein [Ralstonia solanacearum]MDC6301585.1 hypothetical protein [Ralstonia solanacearum]